ncbi:MAG TPA: hypothetical protein VMY18_09430, partial [Acidobacteriota bacterium]|nr:hypothetical protein [Acidobacteriota bacterium]
MGAQSKMSLTEKDKEAIRSLVEEMSDSLAGQGMTEDFAKWQAYYSVGSSLLPPVSMTELYFFLKREEQVKEKRALRHGNQMLTVEDWPEDDDDTEGPIGIWDDLMRFVVEEAGPVFGRFQVKLANKREVTKGQSAIQNCNGHKNRGNRKFTLPADRRARTRTSAVDPKNPEGFWWLRVRV